MTRQEVFIEVKAIINSNKHLSEKEKAAVYKILESDLPEGDNFYCYPSEVCDIVFEMGSAQYYITYSESTLEIYDPQTDYVVVKIGINHLIAE